MPAIKLPTVSGLARCLIALTLALAAPRGHSQLHFETPVAVSPQDLLTGNDEVDSQIQEFFSDFPGLRLSYNVLWTGTTANLDGGVHSISQTSTITVGNSSVFSHERQHHFSFSLELVRNDDEDYYIRVRWKITDPSDWDGIVYAEGVQSIARTRKSQPGSQQSPARSRPEPHIVMFEHANPVTGGSGRWETVELPAQRCYIREDGAFVVVGYTIRLSVFIPNPLPEGGGGNHEQQ